MDRWVDGLMDGWMDVSVCVCDVVHSIVRICLSF